MSRYSHEAFRPLPIAAGQEVSTRRHQGIPGVEILPSGRLFATWYGGELEGEGPGNYQILSTSADGGRSWKEIQTVTPIRPDERAYDGALWLDPEGRLWWFWCQCLTLGKWDIFDGRAGVWAVVCDQPDTDSPIWSEPRRLWEGVMLNKPTVLADGSWAFPVALWGQFKEKILPEFAEVSRANLLITRDRGENFELVVGPDMPGKVFDEHMLVERRDGSFHVLVRTGYGIGQSFSYDRGKTWVDTGDSGLGGPNSRFVFRRLRSGRILLVNHQTTLPLPGEGAGEVWRAREKLTAWLSEDDGVSWHGRLMLDERMGVSYPDVAEGDDGFLYVIYDRERVKLGQVLLMRFTEEDVKRGELCTPGAARMVVSAFPTKKYTN